jgi:hypothetical protein|tara:strand:+ start:2555 stop:3469 length:915 start_codon:yes stop_codon:yes gene_type:complete
MPFFLCADTFYQTAENFRTYMAKCDIGFSRTSTAHNIWTEIVAGEKQYAKVKGRLNSGAKLETCFDPDSFISIMRSHQRIVDEKKATEIFAESIYPQLEKISPLIYSVLSKYSDPQKYCFHGSMEYLSVFEKGLPGYLKVLQSPGIEDGKMKAVASLLNYYLDHDSDRYLQFFANAFREGEKTAELQLKLLFKTNSKWLVSKLASDVFDTSANTYDFELLRNAVYEGLENSIQEYKSAGGLASFLDGNNNIVADFIDLVAAGLVSNSKWVIESDEMEVEISQIEFIIERSLQRLFPENTANFTS